MASYKSVFLARIFVSAVAILPVVLACILGQIATFPNLVPWYAGLAKPVFNPPNWLFAPVWTVLYILMICAVWRVLAGPQKLRAKRRALTFFFAQLALNALWPWLFFYLHSPLAGLVEIIPQLILILATIHSFHRLNRLAAWCLVPLAAWVAFATLLNAALWGLTL